MPYKIDWNDNNTVITFNGEVSMGELRKVSDAHYGAESLDELDYLIADFADADLSQLKVDLALTIASLDSITRSYKPDFKIAFIVSDDYQKILCEGYIEYSKQLKTTWQYGIFNNSQDAHNWIEEITC